MASRRRSREHALQILFQWDVRKQPIEECISAFYETLHADEEEQTMLPYDQFMEELAGGTAGRIGEIDRHIEQHSAHWRIDRMPVVDRNILRMATFELLVGSNPPAVVIDEALELARRFSGDESVGFVNGVLDSVRKALGTEQQQHSPPPINGHIAGAPQTRSNARRMRLASLPATNFDRMLHLLHAFEGTREDGLSLNRLEIWALASRTSDDSEQHPAQFEERTRGCIQRARSTQGLQHGRGAGGSAPRCRSRPPCWRAGGSARSVG